MQKYTCLVSDLPKNDSLYFRVTGDGDKILISRSTSNEFTSGLFIANYIADGGSVTYALEYVDALEHLCSDAQVLKDDMVFMMLNRFCSDIIHNDAGNVSVFYMKIFFQIDLNETMRNEFLYSTLRVARAVHRKDINEPYAKPFWLNVCSGVKNANLFPTRMESQKFNGTVASFPPNSVAVPSIIGILRDPETEKMIEMRAQNGTFGMLKTLSQLDDFMYGAWIYTENTINRNMRTHIRTLLSDTSMENHCIDTFKNDQHEYVTAARAYFILLNSKKVFTDKIEISVNDADEYFCKALNIIATAPSLEDVIDNRTVYNAYHIMATILEKRKQEHYKIFANL